MKLKHKHKKEKLKKQINKNLMPEFIDTFRLKSVYCNVCKLIALQKDDVFTICENVEQLRFEAFKEHTKMIEANQGVICIEPEFIISYESVLVSNGLLNPKEKSSLIM